MQCTRSLFSRPDSSPDKLGARPAVRRAAATVQIEAVESRVLFSDIGADKETASLENLESAVVATVTAPTVLSFTLVNADTDQDLFTLTDGMTLDLSKLPTRNLSVRADVAGSVASVKFALDSNSNYRTESSAPYALSGDTIGNYNAWTPSLGTHALSATPYSGTKASGTAGAAVSISFRVVDSVLGTAPTKPAGLTATPASAQQVNLKWADNSTNESGFKLERSSDGVTWKYFTAVGASLTSYSDSGLQGDSNYYYRVRAYNSVGHSTYTYSLMCTTPEAPVTQPPVTQPPVTQPPTNTGAQPGPTNTGPTNPSILKQMGSITVTVDGTVLENIEVTGTINIKANNVTIRNFKINANSYYGVRCSYGFKNLVLEDGEITGMGSAGIYGGDFTARRLNIHHSGGDGIKPSGNAVVESSWIHHLGEADGAHADGVQIMRGSHFVFRNNFFDMPKGVEGTKSNAAFMIQSNNGPIDDIVIDGNWMNGGNFTIQCIGTSYGAPTNVRMTNNLFGRDYKYGIKRLHGDVAWTNNRWWDTLELIV